MTTKREYEERAHYYRALQSLGFTHEECEQLRRISMTLRRWHEAECNGDIQRDEREGKAYRHYGQGGNGPFLTVRCADKETGAHKRLAAIIGQRNGRPAIAAGRLNAHPMGKVSAYIQGDPRGAALYILRPGDVPEGADAGSYYTRGICVF